MKKMILLLLLVTCFFSSVTHSQSHSYVNKHNELAQNLSVEFGIPKSIILSIAIIESGAGSSKVARKLNNHFGIKGKNNVSWSRFKQYSSVEDSFRDFCMKISSKKFYTNLKGNDDYLIWLKKISLTGYSTKPKLWLKKLKRTILLHKLES